MTYAALNPVSGGLTQNCLTFSARGKFCQGLGMGELENRITISAQELGIDLVGITSLQAVLASAANGSAEADRIERSPHNESADSLLTNGVARRHPWSSVIVLALAHPERQPELDWFSSSGNTPGNSRLIQITSALAKCMEETENIAAQPLHYYVNKGGIYLKDTAVRCGLGCIGRNNLLVTPEFGPRVRLRALVVEAELETTRPIEFDPCIGCPEFCRQSCPQEAFAGNPVSTIETTGARFPGRDGSYQRASCMRQMDLDWATSACQPVEDNRMDMDESLISTADTYVVKHCRRCELACPVGSGRG